jgi:hypothetical protein
MFQVLNFCFVFLEEKHGNGRQDNITQVNNRQRQVKQKPEKLLLLAQDFISMGLKHVLFMVDLAVCQEMKLLYQIYLHYIS